MGASLTYFSSPPPSPLLPSPQSRPPLQVEVGVEEERRGVGEEAEGECCVEGLLELLLLLLLVLELSVVHIDGVRESAMGSLPGGGHRSSLSYF